MLPRNAGDQFSRLQAACLRWGRSLHDWYQRPTSRELRGRKLLREWLSPEQRAQYDALDHFDVKGCHTGKRYRIHHGTTANVLELDEAGRPRAGWCFVPNDQLVAGDAMLAQKIAIETDEHGALAVANEFKPRRYGSSNSA
jgi:hypothetical protein